MMRADAQKGEQKRLEQTNRYYKSPADALYMALVYLVAGFSLLSVLVPIVYVLAASFSTPEAIMAGKVRFWPVDFTLAGYRAVFTHPMLMAGFRNSLLYTAVGTTLNVFMTVVAAYPLSRSDLKIRGGVMFLFSFTMLFGGGMIPNYLLVRNLGLIDSIGALILPGAMSVWNVIIMRTYFQTNLPQEMLESASIDGCDDFRFLLRIALPLSVPILAVQVLLYAVGHWNAFFNAMLYINTPDKYPLQLVLRDVLVQNNAAAMTADIIRQMEREQMRYLLQYATIVVACIPVMILYPFIQRYFTRGIMVGAIKG
ncbi:MAG TPA: carbohydrate ABC transporter permease [Clostridia bacterium]|nr:carbohydrate ABC transporter permease [Clostridia bacterium]